MILIKVYTHHKRDLSSRTIKLNNYLMWNEEKNGWEHIDGKLTLDINNTIRSKIVESIPKIKHKLVTHKPETLKFDSYFKLKVEGKDVMDVELIEEEKSTNK